MYSRRLDGRTLIFGHEGVLYKNSFVLYDKQTNSLWVHTTGEAIRGPLKGKQLTFLPSKVTTWERWRSEYPRTLVLNVRRGGRVMSAFMNHDRSQYGLSVGYGKQVKLYPFARLPKDGIVNDDVDGLNVVVVVDGATGMGMAFERGDLVFKARDGQMVDQQGRVWDRLKGRSGERALRPVPATPWLIDRWLAFFYPGGLAAALGFGFLAGLILNVMPCVLPVVSLKVYGFVKQAGTDRRRTRILGLAFGAGILFVFLILAALAAFAGLGWGQQFQSDPFLVVLIALMVAFALGMFEVYTIRLPGFVNNVEAATAGQEGVAGSFMKGMLATLLATPCSGPFLGATLSYALIQPPGVIFAVFSAVGLGMAFPYLLLSWNPNWLRIVPRPGEWMNTFKGVLGFLMLGSAAWLLWQRRANGELVVWTVVFCLFVAFGAWLYGRWTTPLAPAAKRFAAPLVAAALIGLGAYFCFGFMYTASERYRSFSFRFPWQSRPPTLAQPFKS